MKYSYLLTASGYWVILPNAPRQVRFQPRHHNNTITMPRCEVLQEALRLLVSISENTDGLQVYEACSSFHPPYGYKTHSHWLYEYEFVPIFVEHYLKSLPRDRSIPSSLS